MSNTAEKIAPDTRIRVLIAALAVAFIVRTYVHVTVFFKIPLRDPNDLVLHVLSGVLSCAAIRPLKITWDEALAAAIIADSVVQLRELLSMLADVCKTHVLTFRARRR